MQEPNPEETPTVTPTPDRSPLSEAVPPGLAATLGDRYALQAVIGRGGMATVYRAHDVKHDRTVALKVLHDDLAASLGPERFKREILIAARLQHPHILSVFDSGEAAGRLWFTMPFVQGESLRDRLQREGPLSVETALAVIREAAQALAYAHKQGVIHRDIKPENILLTEDGSTLVADFGIARAVDTGTTDTGLTQTGLTIGTPAYMAPEQATGDAILDERVDQYGLAAVLYEMLTGAPPFVGANAAALIAARYTSAVTPVRAQRKDVPEAVDVAVQRALALKPAGRFPSITDFARAVAPTLSTPDPFSSVARPRTTGRRGARSWGVAAGVLLLAAAGGGVAYQQGLFSSSPDGPTRIAVLPLQNIGDSTDAYFAEGMSDELRAKLVNLPGMQVIARASSIQYAGTDKTPAQIAAELGVRYLLTGTLRYERRADGSSEVHVRPELMEVTGKGPATTKWQGSFDEPLTNAPALQTKIAEQVASRLQVTLGVTERAALAKEPTTNPAAYDAYLRGINNPEDGTPLATRKRIVDLERAVSLDPNFAAAWAALAKERSLLYANAGATPERKASAQAAADRVRELAPDDISTRNALFIYYFAVTNEVDKAEQEMLAARRRAPDNPLIMSQLAGAMSIQGRVADALPLYDAASKLDPLNMRIWANYGRILMTQRRYAEALPVIDRAAALAPASPNAVLDQVSLRTSMGDLAGARRIVREAYTRIPPEALDVYLSVYYDYIWVLEDEAQRRVLAASADAFGGDVAIQELVQAEIHRTRGDLARSRTIAASAARRLIPTVAEAPTDVQWPMLQAYAYALADAPKDAKRLVETAQRIAVAHPPQVLDVSYYGEVRARIHLLAGEYDKAFDELEAVFKQPGRMSPAHLGIDPLWTPLRGLPRYQRLMATASAQEVR